MLSFCARGAEPPTCHGPLQALVRCPTSASEKRILSRRNRLRERTFGSVRYGAGAYELKPQCSPRYEDSATGGGGQVRRPPGLIVLNPQPQLMVLLGAGRQRVGVVFAEETSLHRRGVRKFKRNRPATGAKCHQRRSNHQSKPLSSHRHLTVKLSGRAMPPDQR